MLTHGPEKYKVGISALIDLHMGGKSGLGSFLIFSYSGLCSGEGEREEEKEEEREGEREGKGGRERQ